MATYYKVTNSSADSERGPRGVFLIEAGKLLKPGDTAYNLRRLFPQTKASADEVGLDIVEQSSPFEVVETAAPQKKPESDGQPALVGKLDEADEPKAERVYSVTNVVPEDELTKPASFATEVGHDVKKMSKKDRKKTKRE